MDVFGGIGHQLGLGHRGPLDHLDIGAGQFARMGIRLANGTDKGHRLMAHQRLFDDGRVNVMPAADDQILGPAGDVKITIRIQPPQIAGA